MIIGIDIGGTHTDAVVTQSGKIIASAKVATLEPLSSCIKSVLSKFAKYTRQVKQIHIGSERAYPKQASFV
jgi:N-methylhydantoinase A/oxoprolinase/acetone carboxylase beta subunit